MRKYTFAATALLCLWPSLSHAQTAIGTGVGTAESNSAAGAIAVNRGNGNSSLTVNNPANTTATVNSTVSGTTTSNINSRVSGTQTVKSAPSMVAPGLAAAGLETCLGSASGTVSAIGFGIGGGSTFADEGCQARLDSRTLYAYGLKSAALARLCQRPDIWRSMPDICQKYWPVGVALPYGITVAAPAYTLSATSPVMRVIDGRDGVEKDCLNYNARAQKCRYWLGDPPPRKPRLSHTPPKAFKPLAAVPAAANTVPIAGAGSNQPTKEN